VQWDSDKAWHRPAFPPNRNRNPNPNRHRNRHIEFITAYEIDTYVDPDIDIDIDIDLQGSPVLVGSEPGAMAGAVGVRLGVRWPVQ